MTCLPLILLGLVCVGTALVTALVVRILANRAELNRLKRNGHKTLYFKRLSERGFIDHDFMRGIVELGGFVLLLGAVLGWLSHSTPQ